MKFVCITVEDFERARKLACGIDSIDFKECVYLPCGRSEWNAIPKYEIESEKSERQEHVEKVDGMGMYNSQFQNVEVLQKAVSWILKRMGEGWN